LDFSFFVGDVMSGIGLGIFGPGYQAHCKSQFLTQYFTGN